MITPWFSRRPKTNEVVDIAYIRTGEGRDYLYAVLGCTQTRSWAGRWRRRNLALKAEMTACWSVRIAAQPSCTRIASPFLPAPSISILQDHHIMSSMSDVGHCDDNAAAEGFFG